MVRGDDAWWSAPLVLPHGTDYALRRRRLGPAARPAQRLAAQRRARPEPGVRRRAAHLVGRRVGRPRRARRRGLRAARGHLHPAGHPGRRDRPPAAPGRARGRGRRAHAGRGVPRGARLGLRRRRALCGARGLRRAGGPPTLRRRGAPRGRRRLPRRGLQPPRPVRELPDALRPVLHRHPPHPVGLGGQPRRTRRRGHAGVHPRQRGALAARTSTSTRCGSTRCTRWSTTPSATCSPSCPTPWPTSPAGSGARCPSSRSPTSTTRR